MAPRSYTPTLTFSPGDFFSLTLRQHAWLYFEGKPAMATSTVLWLCGVILSLVAQYVPGIGPLVYIIVGLCFMGAAIPLRRVLRTLEKGRAGDADLLRSLFLMGAKHPRRYLTQHPEAHDAYHTVRDALHELPAWDREDLSIHHAAMLVFLTERPGQAAARIVGIVRDRHITDIQTILSLLTGMDEQPAALSDGAL